VPWQVWVDFSADLINILYMYLLLWRFGVAYAKCSTMGKETWITTHLIDLQHLYSSRNNRLPSSEDTRVSSKFLFESYQVLVLSLRTSRFLSSTILIINPQGKPPKRNVLVPLPLSLLLLRVLPDPHP
jgi:hypothetical protein